MSVELQIRNLIKQLYPTGRAWNYITDGETKEIVYNFVDGVGDPFVDGVGDPFVINTGSENSDGKKVFIASAKSYERLYNNIVSILNGLIADNENFDETDASNWERVLGLLTSSLTLEERKAAILRKQAYPNGVQERAYYLFVQEQLRLAGFDVYVHENRFYDGVSGWEVVDPDDLVSIPYQLGTAELGVAELGGATSGITYSIIANSLDESVDANYFNSLSNPVELGVTQLGTDEMQKQLELDRDVYLRYSFFVGGEIFPNLANVSSSRKTEFRELILKLKQLHTVGFLLINYT